MTEQDPVTEQDVTTVQNLLKSPDLKKAVTAKGQVVSLLSFWGGAHVVLDYEPPEGLPHPKGKNFTLKLDHPNYSAVYSLILSAATHRHPLLLRAYETYEDLDPNKSGHIAYARAQW